MAEPEMSWKWNLVLSVFHGREFGHTVFINTQSSGRPLYLVDRYDWKGLGVPADRLRDIRSCVDSVISDYLITRYGIQGVLGFDYPGEEGPF